MEWQAFLESKVLAGLVPTRTTLRRLALALVFGTIGGALAHWAGMPLAWLLGVNGRVKLVQRAE